MKTKIPTKDVKILSNSNVESSAFSSCAKIFSLTTGIPFDFDFGDYDAQHVMFMGITGSGMHASVGHGLFAF